MYRENTRDLRDPIDAQVDDLLARWHHWQQAWRDGRGYARANPSCHGYATPTHWDWQNGAEDDRAEAEQMQAVDAAMGTVPNTPQPWNTCLQFEARNLATGARVWASARLPKGAELEVLRLEARNRVVRALRGAGVVG